MMKSRRDVKVKGLPSTDLLVCIPTRSHLALMPKTTSSPNSHRHQQHHRGKSIGGGAGDGGSWAKKNHMGLELSEPGSPKVTCVGQIKARPKSRSCKNWQTVMEEIDRLQNGNNKKHRKKLTLGDALGFKKDSMQFLTSLRSFKFDLRCFGAFPSANIISDDEDDDDNDNENDNDKDDDIINDDDLDDHEKGSSRRAFSNWLMVCEENQDFGLLGKKGIDDQAQLPCVPPSNALILMRCRSAPVKSVVEYKHKDNENDEDKENDYDLQENGDKKENLTELMINEGDFYKLSCDIAKETWVVGGINKDPCSSTQTSNRCSTECLKQVKACLS